MTDDSTPRLARPAVRNFRDLLVWQRAIQLAGECNQVCTRMARRDRVGLSRQLRRAACSISANIAEGHGRFGRPEYLKFLGIANGSLREVESHLVLAVELGYITEREALTAVRLANETSRMLVSLARRLRANDGRS